VSHHLDLSDKDLITVPDICALIDIKDADAVWSLDLSDNAIRILNVDLSCLSYLRKLDLSGNNIQAIQTLGELPALRELDMENNELTTTEDFPDLPMLERLNLAFNKLKEVKDLEHLKNLVVLEIQNNAIEYIIGVERLEKLQQLKVDYEKIKNGDITPIMDKLEDLEIMDQLGNAIGEQLKQELLNNLPFQI
jgi:Leucine-rich repeat (LRR) protein